MEPVEAVEHVTKPARARLRDHGVFVAALAALGTLGAAVAFAPERNADLVERLDLASASALVESGEPAVVLFSVTGCRFCSASRRFLKDVAAGAPDRATFAEVDLEDALPLAERFDVSGVPTVLVLRDSKVLRRGLSLETVQELDDALSAAPPSCATASYCPPRRPR